MRVAGRHIGRDRQEGHWNGLLPRLLSVPALFPALSVSVLLLAGCATDAPSGPSIAAPQAGLSQGPAANDRATALPGLGVTSGLIGLLPEAPARPDNMSLAPQAGTAAAAPELVGMTAQQLGGLLGQPRYLRRENPAQVWQYTDRRCILDIFLYPEQGEYRVVHVETRDPRSLSALNVGSCLNGLAVVPASLRGS